MLVVPTLLVVALAVVLAAYFRSSYYNNETYCQDYKLFFEQPYHFTGNTCQVFSPDYATARQRFRDACPTPTTALAVVVQKNDDDYTMDVCVVPGAAPGLVVHVSGTHGVEGYAGSAIQVAYLKHIQTNQQNNNTDPTLVFTHAFNPYGMAKYRRFNENNVDCNRNGLTDEEWTTYAVKHWNYHNFELMRPFFAPSLVGTYFWPSLAKAAWLAIVSIIKYGIPTLKQAMVGGQYHDPAAIFYGGQKREKSFDVLDDWLDGFLSTSNASAREDVVTWIDVHTGLGKSGQDTLLTMANAEDREEICQWFPGTECSMDATASVNQGYEQVLGGAVDYIQQTHFSSAKHPLFFAQEFGTVPLTAVGMALIIENAAHNKGLDWAFQTTRLAFYPQFASWRMKILENGLRVIHQAKRRSAQLSRQ